MLGGWACRTAWPCRKANRLFLYSVSSIRPNTDVKGVKAFCESGCWTAKGLKLPCTYARRRPEAIVLDEGSIPSDSTIFNSLQVCLAIKRVSFWLLPLKYLDLSSEHPWLNKWSSLFLCWWRRSILISVARVMRSFSTFWFRFAFTYDNFASCKERFYSVGDTLFV